MYLTLTLSLTLTLTSEPNTEPRPNPNPTTETKSYPFPAPDNNPNLDRTLTLTLTLIPLAPSLASLPTLSLPLSFTLTLIVLRQAEHAAFATGGDDGAVLLWGGSYSVIRRLDLNSICSRGPLDGFGRPCVVPPRRGVQVALWDLVWVRGRLKVKIGQG